MMDDTQRQSFTDIVFSLLESTGQQTFSAMGTQKWKTVEAMLNAIKNLPKDKQQEAFRLLSQLGQSGGQAAKEYLLELINKQS